MLRLRVLLVGGGVLAGCLAICAVLYLRTDQDQHSQVGSTPAASVTASAEPDEAEQVARALGKLTTDPAALVPGDAPTGVRSRSAQAVPKGSSVTPLPESWQPDGIGGGVMTVKVAAPGQTTVAYAAVMAQEQGEWKVLATLRLPEQVNPPTVSVS